MAPFDNKVTLWAGSKKLSPADYDKRFNFKLSGYREGLVYFLSLIHISSGLRTSAMASLITILNPMLDSLAAMTLSLIHI